MDKATPALERALTVLEWLAARPQGASAAAIAAATGVPRASLYRMLRVLARGSHVVATAQGYLLGPGIARLAAGVPARDLAALAQPVLDALCAAAGQSVKLVVRDGLEALTVAVANSACEARITVRIGTRMPLYVGASQRLLLSQAPQEVVAAVLAAPRRRHASGTIVAVRDLRRSLAELAGADVVTGYSEGIEGLGAVAARIVDAAGTTPAVLVCVYLQAGKSVAQLREIREATERAARALSRMLGGA